MIGFSGNEDGKRVPKAVASLVIALAIASALALGGCTVSKPTRFMDAKVEGENVVISKADIGEQARFVNYDAGGTTVQLLAVESTDGKPHVALNTCQSCNPSPKAYYKQKGDILTCNNCGLEFSVDTVGAEGAPSCNPAPVQDIVETDDAFVVPVSVLEAYAPFFKQWKGPIS